MSATLIFSEELLPQWNTLKISKVLSQEIDENGKLIGIHNNNPLLNNIVYDVGFPDGAFKRYGANIICKKILFQ